MFCFNLQQLRYFLNINVDTFLSFKDTILVAKSFVKYKESNLTFFELWPICNIPTFQDVAVVSQGSSDPGGEQVGPGGAQQHGDHPAHHEPAQ